MALRRDLIESVGPLDEDFFLGIEDLELSWRLREQGYWLRVALDVFVGHLGHASFNTVPEAKKAAFIQQGSDRLYEKMRRFYYPNPVPHPQDYFGISWWRPSILNEKSEAEVFAPKTQPEGRRRVLRRAKELLFARHADQAVDLLRKALHLSPHDFGLWYTLGSTCMAVGRLEEAEIALRNAHALEFGSSKAEHKLASLHRLAATNQPRLSRAAVSL